MKQNKILKEFIRYTIQNVSGMIGLSCYILADTFFISKGLGASGLAALNLAIPIYSFVNGSGLMLGMGGATKFSILRGQGAHRQADEVFSNTVRLAAILSALFMLTGLFGAKHHCAARCRCGSVFHGTYLSENDPAISPLFSDE